MALTRVAERAQRGLFGAPARRRVPLYVAPGAEGGVAIVEVERALAIVTTVIVKRTFRIAAGGELTAVPVAWSVDAPSRHLPDHPEALATPSDFVPWKPRLDVTVAGHAAYRTAREGGPITIEIAGRRILRSVGARGATASLPLSFPYLHGEQLAPRRAGSPGGGRYPASVPDDAFQHAAPDLQLPLGIVEDAPRVALTGLIPGFEDGPLVLSWPAGRPLLRAIDRAGRERGVDAALDTVHVDLDARTVALVYRETLAGRPADSVSLDGWRAPGIAATASVDAPRSRSAIAAAATEDDAALERTPTLSPHVRWAAEAEALAGRSPAPTLDLGVYARVHAALAERPTRRVEVLRAHGLDGARWSVEDRAWLERMAEESLRGDPTTAAAFGDLFVEEQDRYTTAREEAMTVPELARLKVLLEGALDLDEALSTEELTLAQWMRIERRSAERAAEDPGFARDLDQAVARERARVGGEA